MFSTSKPRRDEQLWSNNYADFYDIWYELFFDAVVFTNPTDQSYPIEPMKNLILLKAYLINKPEDESHKKIARLVNECFVEGLNFYTDVDAYVEELEKHQPRIYFWECYIANPWHEEPMDLDLQ